MPGLVVENLEKRYGKLHAVRDLSFAAPAGALTCLIGPNGAGKSTTMRMIAGLQRPDSGRIEVGDVDCSADPMARKQRVALTPQELALFDELSARESIEVVGRFRGLSRDDAVARGEAWLERTGLTFAADRLVRTFSGGMRRKLAVGLALLAQPDVLILDESFTGLDPESTQALQRALREYCDAGGAVLLSSHILDMVQTIADRVVVMVAGHCVATFEGDALREMGRLDETSLTAHYLNLSADHAARSAAAASSSPPSSPSPAS